LKLLLEGFVILKKVAALINQNTQNKASKFTRNTSIVTRWILKKKLELSKLC